MRRLVRPRSRLIRALPFDEERPAASLIERVNRGEVQTAPPKVTPPGAVTVGQVAEGALPSAAPDWLIDLLRRAPWSVYLPVVLALIIALILGPIGFAIPAVIAALIGAAVTGIPAGRPATCAPSRHADRRGADAGIHRGPARQF